MLNLFGWVGWPTPTVRPPSNGLAPTSLAIWRRLRGLGGASPTSTPPPPRPPWVRCCALTTGRRGLIVLNGFEVPAICDCR